MVLCHLMALVMSVTAPRTGNDARHLPPAPARTRMKTPTAPIVSNAINPCKHTVKFLATCSVFRNVRMLFGEIG